MVVVSKMLRGRQRRIRLIKGKQSDLLLQQVKSVLTDVNQRLILMVKT